VGATLVLDPPFRAKPPEEDWTLALTIDEGEWLAWPLGRRPPQGEEGRGFSAEGRTLRFFWPKGYQGFKTNELRVRVRGRRESRIAVEDWEKRRTRPDVRLGALLSRPLEGREGRLDWSLAAHERFDEAADLERGLGVRELVQEWTDEELEPGASWYYARVVQRDGEMAWSSPIFVELR
jgi:hypothetical protein